MMQNLKSRRIVIKGIRPVALAVRDIDILVLIEKILARPLHFVVLKDAI